MIFTPYPDESEKINAIRKIRNEDYALIRMTYTMIDKNNLDANGILRELLYSWGLVDYEELPHGGSYGITYPALFIEPGRTEKVNLKFYRVNNSRGDRRFSIETVKRKKAERRINENDLLYISIFRRDDGTPQIYFLNLTNNVPGEEDIRQAVGVDEITALFVRIRPKLQWILRSGYFDNSKGYGPIAPKDVGDTIEYLLGIVTNNRPGADFEGLIEIKSKGGSRTLDTLFTLRPHFEGTRVAEYEPNDRSRVSAFARLYGYDSDAHPGYSNLYITIGTKEAPQNNQGFYLQVDDEKRVVNLFWEDQQRHSKEVAAYWTFDELHKQLKDKHPSTLWVKADVRDNNGMVQFNYREIEFSRGPQFTTFINLIKQGLITYDWRGYTTKEGKYSGKNHGNAWRIKPYARKELFGDNEIVELQEEC